MARRGLTLLELLLALSLLLALGALVLPVAVDSMRRRAFEANTDSLFNQLLLARAHAGASGWPVEAIYEADPPRVQARYFQEENAPEENAPGGFFAAKNSPGAFSSRTIVEGWATFLLPANFSVTARPPGGDDAPGPPAGTPPRSLRLALFMPDGSALLCRPVWIGDGAGNLSKLVINPWTGLSSLEASPEAEGRAESQEKKQPAAAAQDDDAPAPDLTVTDGPVADQDPQEEDTP